MYHDNKACEMCEVAFVVLTVRPAALPLKVDVEDPHDKCQQKCMATSGKLKVWPYSVKIPMTKE